MSDKCKIFLCFFTNIQHAKGLSVVVFQRCGPRGGRYRPQDDHHAAMSEPDHLWLYPVIRDRMEALPRGPRNVPSPHNGHGLHRQGQYNAVTLGMYNACTHDDFTGNTENLSTLLALCEGNPSVTDGFPSLRASNAELWSFLCCWTNIWVYDHLGSHGFASLCSGVVSLSFANCFMSCM